MSSNNYDDKTLQEYEKDLDALLSKIYVDKLKDFCKDILLNLNSYDSNKNKYYENLKIAYFMVEYLKARKLYNELQPNKQTDAAIVSILLHNVYFNDTVEDWQDVFTLRNKTAKLIEDKYNTSDVWDVIQYIYQVVEAQLGELMPVPANRPVNGQITYIVWEVLWLYKNIGRLKD